jgi:hypothetical protein
MGVRGKVRAKTSTKHALAFALLGHSTPDLYGRNLPPTFSQALTEGTVLLPLLPLPSQGGTCPLPLAETPIMSRGL